VIASALQPYSETLMCSYYAVLNLFTCI